MNMTTKHNRKHNRHACLTVFLAGLLISCLTSVARPDGTEGTRGHAVLGIQGTHFTLNGQPTFLLGISYYGGLGAPKPFVRRDLDDLQQHGFNWLRVWATWGAFDHDISAVDTKGQAREPYLEKLVWLVAECDRRAMVVDVTLTRGPLLRDKEKPSGITDSAAHRQAVKTLVQALSAYHNWYIDLANEHDVRNRATCPMKN